MNKIKQHKQKVVHILSGRKNSILRNCAIFLCFAAMFGAVTAAAADSEEVEWKWSRYGIEKTENLSAVPTGYPENDWKWKWYEEFRKTDFSSWATNVLFLGDSITYGWNAQKDYPDGAAVLKEFANKYPDIRPYSLGVSGDKTENTLWLITEGKILDLFRPPRVIVVMIGINSLNAKNEPEQVAEGIENIVNVLRRIRPQSKVLLLGIWPCWGANAPVREKVKATNKIISRLADFQDIFYLDFGSLFLDENNNMNPELSYDAIHLTESGYRIWAEAMFPYLHDLVQNSGEGEIWQNPRLIDSMHREE